MHYSHEFTILRGYFASHKHACPRKILKIFLLFRPRNLRMAIRDKRYKMIDLLSKVFRKHLTYLSSAETLICPRILFNRLNHPIFSSTKSWLMSPHSIACRYLYLSRTRPITWGKRQGYWASPTNGTFSHPCYHSLGHPKTSSGSIRQRGSKTWHSRGIIDHLFCPKYFEAHCQVTSTLACSRCWR